MSGDELNQATRTYMKMSNTKGIGHPLTVDALERLANVCLEQSQFEDALKHYETLLEALQQLPQESPDRLLTTRERIANILVKTEQFELAVPMYEQIYSDCIASRTVHDTLCNTVMLGLINAYRSAGKTEQLFEFAEPVFEELRKQHQFQHYIVVALAETLSELYSKREDHERAIALMRELCDYSNTKLGALHDVTLEHMRLFILRLKSAAKYVEAIRYSKSLIQAKSKRHGAHCQQLFDVYTVMYRIYDEAKMFIEAQNILVELLSNPIYRTDHHAHVMNLLEETYKLDYELMVESKQKVAQIEQLILSYPENSETRMQLELRFANYKELSRKFLMLDLKPLDEIVPRT